MVLMKEFKLVTSPILMATLAIIGCGLMSQLDSSHVVLLRKMIHYVIRTQDRRREKVRQGQAYRIFVANSSSFIIVEHLSFANAIDMLVLPCLSFLVKVCLDYICFNTFYLSFILFKLYYHGYFS